MAQRLRDDLLEETSRSEHNTLTEADRDAEYWGLWRGPDVGGHIPTRTRYPGRNRLGSLLMRACGLNCEVF